MVTKANSPIHLISFPTNPCLTVSNSGMSTERTMNPLKTSTTKTNQGKTESTASLLLMLLLHIGVRGTNVHLHVVYAILHQIVIIPNRPNSFM